METHTPQPVRQQRRYGPDEVARVLAVLAENDGNAAATSRQTGVPVQTIKEWKYGRVDTPPPSLVEQQKAVRAANWDEVQDMGVEQALARLPEASARDAAVVAGIAVDKAALLRGEATQIVQHQDDERLAALRERYARLHPVQVTAHDTPKQLPAAQQDTPPEGGSAG